MISTTDRDHPGYGFARPGLDPFDMDYLRGRAETVPDDWTRWFLLGWLCLRECQYEQAEVSFRKTVELAPENGLAFFLYGKTLSLNGKGEHAVAVLRQATSMRPDLADAWRLLGSMEQVRGRYRAAVYALHECARLAPDGEVYWQIGDCLSRLGEIRQATVVLEHAVALKPNHLLAHRALVLIGMSGGDEQLARRHRQRLFEINEDRARKFEEDFDDFERRLARSRTGWKATVRRLLSLLAR